jgi:hypothetical protein
MLQSQGEMHSRRQLTKKKEMHSRYSTSDKDANAGRSSVENSGNTKNAWVRR